jgi:hypothetical protein
MPKRSTRHYEAAPDEFGRGRDDASVVMDAIYRVDGNRVITSPDAAGLWAAPSMWNHCGAEEFGPGKGGP